MGVDVELVEGVGPVIAEPIRTLADVERLRVPEPEESVAADPRGGARSCARELRAEQAVVGFCGGPFTVAGYLVEGRPSREFAHGEGADVRASRTSWHALMEKLADDVRALRRRAGRARART